MNKYYFVFVMMALTTSAFARNKCIETKCGESPSYLLLDQKGAELKKSEEIFARFNKCVTDCSRLEKDEIEYFLQVKIYSKEKEAMDFCEKMLPRVLKDSYDSKVLNVTNITKSSPTSNELNKMILNRVNEKRNLCQAHLDGKFDKEIYSQKMSDLKFCFERMKDAKSATKEFDQFQKVKTFIDNRAKKVMLDSSRSADLINVQNKLDDCQKNLAESDSLSPDKINQAERGQFKSVPASDVIKSGNSFHPNSVQK